MALLLLAALLLAGCGGRKNQDDSLRIGVALYTQDDTFISAMAQDLEGLVREAESETGKKITLFIADGKSSQNTQMDQVDRFLARGCDVLFVNLVDRTAAAVIIDKAEAEGVPLIFFNRQPVAEDIQRWSQIYYVGASAQESGALQTLVLKRDYTYRGTDELEEQITALEAEIRTLRISAQAGSSAITAPRSGYYAFGSGRV